jgi:hypothetical protein
MMHVNHRASDEIHTLRAQVETLTRERDEARVERDNWIETARNYATNSEYHQGKVRRLVECVRRVKRINTHKVAGIECSTNHFIAAALATVSDITAPTDEVQS